MKARLLEMMTPEMREKYAGMSLDELLMQKNIDLGTG